MASKKQYYCIKDCFFRNRKYSAGEGPYAFDKPSETDKAMLKACFEDKAPAPAKKEEQKEYKTFKEMQDDKVTTPFG
jgi:hypothetical protein